MPDDKTTKAPKTAVQDTEPSAPEQKPPEQAADKPLTGKQIETMS